jgi:hypothetical protein
MPRVIPLLLAAVVCACQADPFTIPELPETPPPAGSLELAARIDGRIYEAADPDGFAVGRIEVNKGGIRLNATFRGTSGAAINAVDYELTVAGSADGEPLPERVAFTRVDAFSGTLYWIAPGQAVELWVGLYHGPTGRHVFGPYPIVVERRSHDRGEEPPPDSP